MKDIHWWTRLVSEVRAAGCGDAPLDWPIRTICEGLGFDCAVLVGDRVSGVGRHPVLVNIGYPVEVVGFIASTYAAECPGHAYVLTHPQATRFIDLPFDIRETRTYREALQPHGFKEGITLPLTGRTSSHAHPGFVALSSKATRPLDEASQLALTMIAGELADLIDPDMQRCTIRADIVVGVDGGSVHERFGTLADAALSNLDIRGVAEMARKGQSIGIRHRGMDGQWWQIEPLVRSRDTLIRMMRVSDFCGLTARELDVVGLLSRGWSNQQIASALSISIRTTRSHVESVLRKTVSRNRTALAHQAIHNSLDSYNALRFAALAT